MPYHHTQRGLVILLVCLAAGAFGAAITWRTGQIPMIAMLVDPHRRRRALPFAHG